MTFFKSHRGGKGGRQIRAEERGPFCRPTSGPGSGLPVDELRDLEEVEQRGAEKFAKARRTGARPVDEMRRAKRGASRSCSRARTGQSLSLSNFLSDKKESLGPPARGFLCFFLFKRKKNRAWQREPVDEMRRPLGLSIEELSDCEGPEVRDGDRSRR